jgi:hypothetical protein
MQVRHRFLRERRVLLLWSMLGLLLFLPTMFLGVIIPFPPLIFGASMAWWLLMTGVAGLIILAVIVRRQFGGNIKIWGHLTGSFRARDAALAVIIAIILYALAYASVALLGEKLRFIVPIFPPLIANRAQILPLFIPFYLIYFAVEGLYLHVYRERQMAGSAAGNLMRTILLKLFPYLAILAVQYVCRELPATTLIPWLLHRVHLGNNALVTDLHLRIMVAVQIYRENLGWNRTQHSAFCMGFRGIIPIHGLQVKKLAVVVGPVVALYRSYDEVPVLHRVRADTAVLYVIIFEELQGFFLDAFGDI